MSRDFLVFAFLVTGGLTVFLGRPAESYRNVPVLRGLVVSKAEAEPEVVVDTVRRGETLATVLGRQTFSAAEVFQVAEALRAYVDPRALKPGALVRVRRAPWDSVMELTLRIDRDREVRLSRAGASWESELKPVTVAVDTLVVEGAIETTLYHSVLSLKRLPVPAQERVERLMWGIYRPFQWSIDFGLDLRRGDTYRAVYERHVRPDGSAREARILAVRFINARNPYEAFWFGPREEYFDAEGGSMKKVFLKAPVDFRRISSRFTRRRYHPVLGRYRAHLGTDYAAAPGTPVHSTADGTVVRAGWWGGYGRMVEVRHINGYRTRYAHLQRLARRIGVGTRVRQGQVIGYVGSTGLANGPHLHYELRRNATPLDPRRVDVPSGTPVSSDRMTSFRRDRDRLRALLDGIGHGGDRSSH